MAAAVLPYSFMDPTGRKCNPKNPAPTYLKQSELVYKQQFTAAEILRGFEEPGEGGLKCIDREVLNKQKGVLASLIAQVATCFFQKGGFVRISLPVRIFEPRSTLDKILDPWRTAPTYLTRAAGVSDPVERMKMVIAFAISGLHLAVTQLKPFNPLLGETLEGGLDDGSLIYCEHVSHHPPISSFLMYGPNNIYQLSGYYQYKMSFSANSLSGTQYGPNDVRFADGGLITYRLPAVKITGLIFGSRLVYYCGYTGGIFSSRKKGSKRDDFDGLLYHFKPIEGKGRKAKKLADLHDVESPIAPISGSWLKNLKIGEEERWTVNATTPSVIWYTNWPLPSDWRFREDLLWLRRGSVPRADFWKVELEVQQRHDRAERERVSKEREKAAKKK